LPTSNFTAPFDVDGLTWEEFGARLGELGSFDRIKLEINSIGGGFIDPWRTYQALTSGPLRAIPKEVFITGECSSCAIIVAMAGHRIVMEKNAIMRFHRVTNDRGDQIRADKRTGAIGADRCGSSRRLHSDHGYRVDDERSDLLGPRMLRAAPLRPIL
jgi:hypothetical protein